MNSTLKNRNQQNTLEQLKQSIQTDYGQLISSGFLVFVAILLGRILGFFRETLVAAKFGASDAADLAVLLLTFPDILINLLLAGAFAQAIIPSFKRLDPISAQRLFFQVSLLALGVFSALAAVVLIEPALFIRLLAPGFQKEIALKAEPLMKVVAWSIPISALAGTFTAYLQSHQRFFVPAMSTFIFNSVVIIGLIWFGEQSGALMMLGLTVVLAAFSRLILQAVSLRNLHFQKIQWLPWRIDRALLIRYFQVFGTSCFLLMLPVIGRSFASFYGAGSLAIFNYAIKLMCLPLAVCLSIFPMVLLPKLSEYFSKNDDESITKGMNLCEESAFLVLLISMTLACVLSVFSYDICQFVFGWGQMDAVAVKKVSLLTMIAMISLPAQGLSGVLTAIFNAKQNPKPLLIIGIVSFVSFILLAYCFSRMDSLLGLMMALCMTYTVIAILQCIYLNRYYRINLLKALSKRMNIKLILVYPFFLIVSLYIRYLTPQQMTLHVISMLVVLIVMLVSALMMVDRYRQVMLNPLLRVMS